MNESKPRLDIVPVRLDDANALIERWHRHHKTVKFHTFSVGVANGDEIVGVAVVHKPSARMADDGWTLEVIRCSTDGTPNACSALYAAAWRATRAMGYRKLITYTLPEEGGASLRGAGWRCLGEAGGGSWHRKSRPRVDKHPLQQKLRWEIDDKINHLLAENEALRLTAALAIAEPEELP